MKKTLALILSVTMLFLLCACSAGSDDGKDTSNSIETTDTNSTTDANSTTGTSGSTTDTTGSPEQPEIPEETVNILHIDEFCGDLARFEADTGYGYMDKTGKIVIKPIYESAQKYFDDELAIVSKDGNSMFIDKTGTEVLTFDAQEYVGEFKNGAYWIERSEETLAGTAYSITYYDRNGEKLCTIENAKNAGELSSFNEWGYAYVYIAGKDQSYDKYMRMIEKTGYSEFVTANILWVESNNLISIPEGAVIQKIAKIDYETRDINFNINYDYGVYYTKKIFIGGKYYKFYDYYDRTKLNSVTAILSMDTHFSEEIVFSEIPELAAASTITDVAYSKINGKEYFTLHLLSSNRVEFSAVIDTEGNVVISPTSKYVVAEKYQEVLNSIMSATRYAAYSFSENGLCKAKDAQTGLYGFIDINGEWVIQPQYKSVTDFSDGEDSVAIVDDNTIINSKGEIIFTPVTPDT